MIIFTDVDGTLYDYDIRLPKSAIEAVRRLRNNGHKVYMVTGRSKAENKQEVWDIGFDGMIGGNGSYVESDGKVLLHQTLNLEQCRRVVDWCRNRNMDFYEETNEGLFVSDKYIENSRETLVRYMIGKGASKQEAEQINVREMIHGMVEGGELYRDDVNKISFILSSYQDLLDAEKEFPDLSVGSWGGKGELALYGDIGAKGVDKGKAIEILLKHLGAAKEDTIAIGDAKADIPMFRACRFSICMASGGQEAKDAADYITDDVDKDGFYKAFEHLGLI